VVATPRMATPISRPIRLNPSALWLHSGMVSYLP